MSDVNDQTTTAIVEGGVPNAPTTLEEALVLLSAKDEETKSLLTAKEAALKAANNDIQGLSRKLSKVEKEVSEKEAKVTELQNSLATKEASMRTKAVSLAVKSLLLDSGAVSTEIVSKLLNTDTVTVGDDGEVDTKTITEQLEGLKKTVPQLFGTSGAKPPPYAGPSGEHVKPILSADEKISAGLATLKR